MLELLLVEKFGDPVQIVNPRTKQVESVAVYRQRASTRWQRSML